MGTIRTLFPRSSPVLFRTCMFGLQLFFVCYGLLGVVEATSAEDAEKELIKQIRVQIPRATAMTYKEFSDLARSPTLPVLENVENQCLSFVLLLIRHNNEESAAQREEFEYLREGIPKPSDIAQEMNRRIGAGRLSFSVAPVTMIHENRINKVTVERKGDIVTGKIAFEVPQLYRGKIHYLATLQSDNDWRIDEFSLPARNLKIVRKQDQPHQWTIANTEDK